MLLCPFGKPAIVPTGTSTTGRSHPTTDGASTTRDTSKRTGRDTRTRLFSGRARLPFARRGTHQRERAAREIQPPSRRARKPRAPLSETATTHGRNGAGSASQIRRRERTRAAAHAPRVRRKRRQMCMDRRPPPRPPAQQAPGHHRRRGHHSQRRAGQHVSWSGPAERAIHFARRNTPPRSPRLPQEVEQRRNENSPTAGPRETELCSAGPSFLFVKRVDHLADLRELFADAGLSPQRTHHQPLGRAPKTRFKGSPALRFRICFLARRVRKRGAKPARCAPAAPSHVISRICLRVVV